MEIRKSRSLRGIEERMEGLQSGSLRYRVLESAKDFKTSWIELGRALYTVYKDRHYKEWGYGSFDVYVARELGIRKQTAMKLLRSYYFLEKEEPAYLKEDYVASADAATIPNYEAVDVLRLARNKKNLGSEDYLRFKKEIFEKGKDYRQARKDLTALIRQRDELEPQEAYQKKKTATVKRFLGTLKSLQREMETSKLLPAPLIQEARELIQKLQEQID